jgi:hypothetical protein
VLSTLKLRPGEVPLLCLPTAFVDGAMKAMTQRVKPYPPTEATDKYGTCPISGLVAMYRDPLTGTRYGSVAAFKALQMHELRTQYGRLRASLGEQTPSAVANLDVMESRFLAYREGKTHHQVTQSSGCVWLLVGQISDAASRVEQW